MNNQKKILSKLILFIILSNLVSACTLPANGNQPDTEAPDQSVDTWHVTTYLDTFDGKCTSEDCSLRDAVNQANEANRPITIYLPSGLYVLNNLGRGLKEDDTARYGDLDVFGNITVIGDGIDLTNISGDHVDRVFHVFKNARLELRGLTIINGRASDTHWVVEKSWTNPLCLLPSRLFQYEPEIDCKWSPVGIIGPADYERKVEDQGGGAIANRGTLRLIDVSLAFNSAKSVSPGLDKEFNGHWGGGGAIKNRGAIFFMEGGFLCNNTAEAGGAIYNVASVMELHEVGFCKNKADETGGAIHSIHLEGLGDNRPINTLINVTMGENTALDDGGVFYMSGIDTEMQNVTIYNNNATGIVVDKGALSIRNTLLADNGSQNCSGSIISLGHNLEIGNSCNLQPNLNDQIGQQPLLSSLTQLGGWYALLSGSPAIDAGDNANCASIDQQGEVRPSGLGCDIGADEFQSSVDVSIAPPSDTIQPAATQPVAVAPTSVTPTNPAPPQAPVIEEPPTPTPLPPTPTLTPVPDPQTASISGKVWNDANGDGTLQNGETPLALQAVQLGMGPCNSSGLANMNSNLAGGYTFTGLGAGTYCVSVERAESCGNVTSATTPKRVTIVLSPGQALSVSFGFQKAIC